MTDVLPGRQGATAPPDGLTAGEGFSVDAATKQLLRLLISDSRDGTEEPSQPVDWDSIWSVAESWRSEELALGSVVLAAREALAREPATTPSALLVRAKRDEPNRTDSRPVVPAVPLPRPELPTGVRTAVAGATWVRNIGIVVVLFAVWQLWGTGIAEAHSQSHLKAQYALLVKEEVSSAGPVADQPTVSATASSTPARLTTSKTPASPTKTAKVPTVPLEPVVSGAGREANLYAQTRTFVEAALPGGVLGRIRIPAIGVDRYFVEGVGEDQLQEGPGRYPGSGLPGQVGNLAIAGHRTTYGAPFFELNHVRVGDKVILDVPQGRAIYTVLQPPFAVSPYDTNVLADFGDARLTLTTCDPPFWATTRLIVVAKLTEWLPIGERVPIEGAHSGTAREGPAVSAVPILHHITDIPAPSKVAALATGRSSLMSVRSRGSAPTPSRAPAAGHATARDASSGELVNDASTVGQGLATEGAGWHFGELPLVLAVLLVLGALGALYGRVARLCTGISRWLVVAPMWAAGLLVLFRALGLLFPADL
jgi:LPXTG-site transpeptidase (sortase) family protein